MMAGVDFLETRFRYSAENCSIKAALDIVGEKWSLLVLREAFYGVRRFDDFHRALGCPRNLLSERLAKLVDHGSELQVALIALMQWGDRWTADSDGPPVDIRHRGCGARVHAVLACESDHGALAPPETEAFAGPGARLVAKA
jgi:DNA-binding HxlR family transcriptional regulator